HYTHQRSRAPAQTSGLARNHSEGLRPSDSPTRALARRFAGALRSRGLTRALVRRCRTGFETTLACCGDAKYDDQFPASGALNGSTRDVQPALMNPIERGGQFGRLRELDQE